MRARLCKRHGYKGSIPRRGHWPRSSVLELGSRVGDVAMLAARIVGPAGEIRQRSRLYSQGALEFCPRYRDRRWRAPSSFIRSGVSLCLAKLPDRSINSRKEITFRERFREEFRFHP
jgi:hypothetical protein